MSTQVGYITSTGKHYKSKPGGTATKIPREVRAQLYQLHLTVTETRREIVRLLVSHGVDTKDSQSAHMLRIIERRG